MAETPTPRITCRADGHFAICPGCEEEFEVVVSEEPDPDARFVLTPGATRAEDKVVYGSRASYDLSAYEQHWEVEHG